MLKKSNSIDLLIIYNVSVKIMTKTKNKTVKKIDRFTTVEEKQNGGDTVKNISCHFLFNNETIHTLVKIIFSSASHR